MTTRQIKLVDNFHIEHQLKRAYFIDGIGTHQQTTLSAGESIWVVIDFGPVARPVSSARIVLGPYDWAAQRQGRPSLSAPA